MSQSCARCGKPPQGYATIDQKRYCHGDQKRPTCYMQTLWERAGAAAAGPSQIGSFTDASRAHRP